MKIQKNKIIFTHILLALSIPVSVLAEQDEEVQPGFSGTVFMGGGYSSGDLSLEDASEDDNKILSSLDHSPNSSSGGLLMVGGELNYLFTTGTMITLDLTGASGMNMVGEAGFKVTQFTESAGYFSLGSYYSQKDVWKDPFVTGTARTKTDEESISMVLGWEEILNSALSLTYGYEAIEVDDDLSGKRNRLLKRKGAIHRLGVDYVLLTTKNHDLSATVVGELGDIEGGAYTFKGGETALDYTLSGKQWDISTVVYFGLRQFDESHPEFNKEREDNRYGVNATYTLYDPLGMDGVFVSLVVAYDKVDSNISFYDQNIWSVGSGVGFTF